MADRVMDRLMDRSAEIIAAGLDERLTELLEVMAHGCLGTARQIPAVLSELPLTK